MKLITSGVGFIMQSIPRLKSTHSGESLCVSRNIRRKSLYKGKGEGKIFDEIGVDGEEAVNLDYLLKNTIPTTMPFTGKFSFKLNREDFVLKIKNLSLDGVDRLFENDSN